MAWFAVASLLHLVAGFFYISSGLVAPLWAVAALMLIWVALAILLVRIRTVGPKVLLVPVAAAIIWVVAISLGGTVLDWTA